MKRFLLTGLMFLGIGQMASFAQTSRTYDDDIYYTSEQATKDAEEQKQKDAARREAQANSDQNRDDEETYASSGADSRKGSYKDYGRSYNENYNDFEDDYYYSSQINRFYYPFYNRGYYSSFYNPYWYDPFWVDPYWGYSPWVRPGVTVSIGFGGPYWSSYWGYNSWFGYSGFNSYYSYPYYATGYGGYWGCGSGFYNGYWNGYYSGLYNNNYGHGYNGYRGASYGPRYSLNSINNSYIRNGQTGYRPSVGNSRAINASQNINTSHSEGPRGSGFRTSNPGQVRNNRFVIDRPDRPDRPDDTRTPSYRRDDIRESRENTRVQSSSDNRTFNQPAQQATSRPDGGAIFNRSERMQQQQNSRPVETQRMEQRSYSPPARMESQRSESPRTSSPSNGGFRGSSESHNSGSGGFRGRR